MTENLNVALQELKQAIAQSGDAPVVIDLNQLGQKFHGLNLRQLVMLTDAPALASFAQLRSADGARVEKFLVDGKDKQQCESTARDILLSESSLDTGDVREVRVAVDGLGSPLLVRDHNDIIYRVTDREAVIDQPLTAALHYRRQPVQAELPQTHAVPPQRPVIVANGLAFSSTAGEVLHGLAAVRVRNSIAAQEIERLVKSTGEQDLNAALAVMNPQMLGQALTQIMLASQQIETLVDALAQRMRALVRLIEQAGPTQMESARAPFDEGAEPMAASPFRAAAGSARAPFPGVRMTPEDDA